MEIFVSNQLAIMEIRKLFNQLLRFQMVKWYVEWHIGGSGCTLGFGINGSVDFTGSDTQLGTMETY